MALHKARARLHPDLLWRLCDVMAYNPTFVLLEAGGSWLPDPLAWDSTNDWAVEELEEIAPELKRASSEPVRAPRRGTFQAGPFVHIAFDGGASKGGDGTAGFVIVNKHGREVIRRGMTLGPGLTNNEAESAACLAAL
jgi:hypothetical protein